MNEITINSYALSAMCRLCLTRDVALIDIFSFSTKMKNEVAVVIMTCAPVQITKGDEMPKFICQVCYTQLEKIHQFQMQAKQSEKTLRQYLQRMHAFDKQITPECSIQKPIEEHFIHNYAADTTVKCEPVELNDKLNMDVNKKNEEPANFNICEEIKNEPSDDDNFTPKECRDDTESILPNSDCNDISYEDTKINIKDFKFSENICINREEKESINIASRMINDDEISPQLKLKDESMNAYSSVLTKSVENTENALFKSDSIEISCEDTKIDLRSSEKLNKPHSADATNNWNKQEETNIHACDVCNARFYDSSLLRKHQFKHTGIKPYQCDICKKCFSHTGHFNTHKRIHTGEKPFQCDLCNASFSDSSILRRHKIIHTGDKPYQCDVCYKRFSQDTSLNKHKRTHTGEKPFQCDICKKCFSQSRYLNVHKRTHTGEKPFQCDFCAKYFSQLSNLVTHKRIHTSEKP